MEIDRHLQILDLKCLLEILISKRFLAPFKNPEKFSRGGKNE